MHYWLVFLLFLTCYGCRKNNTLPFSDCTPQDVKVGEANLMPETRAFFQKFVGKKVVFKNELGNEMVFKNVGGLTRDTNRLLLRLNCNSGIFGNDKSYDFLSLEGLNIVLVSDSLSLNFRSGISSLLSGVNEDTTKTFDTMIYNIGNTKSLCGLGPIIIFSDRGHPTVRTSDPESPFNRSRIITDTTVNNRRLQNVRLRVRGITETCSAGDKPTGMTPYELYFNQKEGIAAFKTGNNEFWVFDRIE